MMIFALNVHTKQKLRSLCVTSADCAEKIYQEKASDIVLKAVVILPKPINLRIIGLRKFYPMAKAGDDLISGLANN